MSTLSTLDTSASFMRAEQSRLDNTVRSTLAPKTLRQIDEAAQDFEATFLSEMLKPMFEGVEVDEIFGGGRGEEVFRDLMIQEYGKTMAQSGGIGLAKHVREELIRQQEGTVK